MKDSIDDKDISVETTKKEFDKVHNKIRLKAFGKVTIHKKEKEDSEENPDDKDYKDATEEEKAEELFQEQKRRAAEEVEKIEASTHNKVGKVWEIKKLIVGGRKAAQEKTAKLAVSKKEIKQVTLTYCKETLANNKPEEGFEDEINRKKEFVRDLLKIEGGSFKASKDTFKKMVDKFKSSNK